MANQFVDKLRESNKSMSLKKISVIVLISAICVVGFVSSLPFLFVGGYIFYEYNRQYFCPRPFDREKWISGSERQLMLNDLFNRYHVLGMNEKDLPNLLGPYDGCGFAMGNPCYQVGTFGMDYLWLVLEVKNGKVVSYYLTSD